MQYQPDPRNAHILKRALAWTQSVPYQVTARWVFYRLLQDGTYTKKKGYKHLLGLLSTARKRFYQEWQPWTLADDTRAVNLGSWLNPRGWGYEDFSAFVQVLQGRLRYNPDVCKTQPAYAEMWFEAAAMAGQFEFYAPPFVPLLAFHGDVSIPEKWKAADRLVERWLGLKKPVHILYYGDLDPKGLEIPYSAWKDIAQFALIAFFVHLKNKGIPQAEWEKTSQPFQRDLHFRRVGLTEDQVHRFNLTENPERPGTWQWEALTDEQAKELIGEAWDLLDQAAYERDLKEAEPHTERLKRHLGTLLKGGG